MFNRFAWKLMSRERLTQNGNPRRVTLIDWFLQRLFESKGAGIVFKLIAPEEKSRQYATSVVPNDSFTAERMSAKPGLIKLALALLPADARSLSWVELGCCDCANLFTLQRQGFEKLSGVEINNKFLESGKSFDPVGFSDILTYCESIEGFVSSSTKAYDIVFSCAVLQHINPNNNSVFYLIAKMAKRYILTIESENQCNPIHYPRNYRNIFEKYGFKQIGHALINSNSYAGVNEGYVGYTIRLFQRDF